VQFGTLGGILLSTTTILILSEKLTNRQFLDWGWRIPFLISALLVAVGLWCGCGSPNRPCSRS